MPKREFLTQPARSAPRPAAQRSAPAAGSGSHRRRRRLTKPGAIVPPGFSMHEQRDTLNDEHGGERDDDRLHAHDCDEEPVERADHRADRECHAEERHLRERDAPIAVASTTLTSDTTAPVERSKPPVRMTTVCPIAASASVAPPADMKWMLEVAERARRDQIDTRGTGPGAPRRRRSGRDGGGKPATMRYGGAWRRVPACSFRGPCAWPRPRRAPSA